ncbi:hypothetical protein [Belliella pelovolcani]|nr:hypothetical protein [Belliella pelovolcani]
MGSVSLDNICDPGGVEFGMAGFEERKEEIRGQGYEVQSTK